MLSNSVLGKVNLAKPNERVNLACVGLGNRAADIIKELYKTGLCNIVALCDVDLGAKHTQEILGMFPDAPKFKDFRVMFGAEKSKRLIDRETSKTMRQHLFRFLIFQSIPFLICIIIVLFLTFHPIYMGSHVSYSSTNTNSAVGIKYCDYMTPWGRRQWPAIENSATAPRC